MKTWLIVCAVVMLLGFLTAVTSVGRWMVNDRGGFGGLITGACLILIGFFGGVIVILAFTM